ncbi:MAG: hypothetical protein AB7N71_13660 [Phycisphaerae bacterium]
MSATFTADRFLEGLKQVIDGSVDLDGDTIKIALLDDTYAPDLINHDFFDDVSAFEVSGTGYTGGGATLASVAISADTVNNNVKLDAADVVWATTTLADVGYAVIYKDSGSAATSTLLFLLTFSASQDTSAANFAVNFAAAGIGRYS